MSASEPNLLLMGLRASGKSTIARALAESQERDLVELDQMVLGRFDDCESVTQIFERHGESAFRSAEANALRRVLNERHGAIVSLGGGAPTAPGVESAIRAARRSGEAIVVYLRLEPRALRARMASQSEADAEQRPSLTGADPLDEIEAVFAARDPLYRVLATKVIEGERPVEHALEELAGWTGWREGA